MVFDRFYENDQILGLFDDLIRRLRFCSMLKYIEDHRNCTASEIIKNVKLHSSTVYDYLNRAIKAQLVKREENSKNNKGRSHHLYIAQPELINFMKALKTKILGFF